MKSQKSLPLVVILCALGCARDVDLQGGLSERQANEAVLALREAGLPADKRASGRERAFAVTVARGDETRALQELRRRGLPRVAAPTEVERRGGVLPLPEEQRATRAREEAAALTQTLEALPAVQEARLHLALPEEDPFAPGSAPSAAGRRATAAVVLRLRAAADAEALTALVRSLVAHGVCGLRPEDVVVALAPPPPPPEPGAPLPTRAGLLQVAPSSRPLALALQSLLLLLGAALVLALGARRRAQATPGAGEPLSG